MESAIIIERAKKALGLKSDTQLSEILGVRKSTLSNWKARNAIDLDILFSKCEPVNLNWLMTGEGEMLKSGGSNLIPLYDAETIGGHIGTDAGTEAAHISEMIDAGDWFPRATAAIHHYGDSMAEYPSGCILVLRRVNDRSLLMNGQNYVIETDEYRVTKKITDEGDYIMAYSTNEEVHQDGSLVYAPFRIPKEAIRNIDLVIGCVLKEFANSPLAIK